MGFCADAGIRAILLDIDGTLYPRHMLHARMLRSMFPSPIVAARYNRVRKKIRLVQETAPTVPPTLEGFRRRQAQMILADSHRDLSEDACRLVERRLENQFYDRWPLYFASIKPFDGMRDALVEARSLDLRLGVLSDFPIANKLDVLGVSDLIESACCSEESGYLKPHPAPFAYLLDRMGLLAQETLFVGDSYDKDVVGAARAGMRSCLLKRGYGAGQRHGGDASTRYPAADLVCGTWQEFTQRVLRS
jgi:putative hydrolase of the HAD superfamily